MSLLGLLVRRGVATHASAPRQAEAAQARGVPGRAAPAHPREFGMQPTSRHGPREPRP